VLVDNLLAAMEHRRLTARYEGYASCPITTSRKTMLLAEFDYSMQPAPSIPLIDTTHERRDMWYLKRYGLPARYWNLILTGRACSHAPPATSPADGPPQQSHHLSRTPHPSRTPPRRSPLSGQPLPRPTAAARRHRPP